MVATSGFWPVLAGLVFTAYAFTIGWRHVRRRHRRRKRLENPVA